MRSLVKSTSTFRRRPRAALLPNESPLRRSKHRSRTGAAVVEFAVIGPFLVLLILGVIEFGRMVMVQQIITNASREGARLASLEGNSATDIVSKTNTYLVDSAVNGASVTVSPTSLGDAGFGDPVSVTVDIMFDQVTWLPSPLFVGGTTLSATTVMRREAVN